MNSAGESPCSAVAPSGLSLAEFRLEGNELSRLLYSCQKIDSNTDLLIFK